MRARACALALCRLFVDEYKPHVVFDIAQVRNVVTVESSGDEVFPELRIGCLRSAIVAWNVLQCKGTFNGAQGQTERLSHFKFTNAVKRYTIRVNRERRPKFGCACEDGGLCVKGHEHPIRNRIFGPAPRALDGHVDGEYVRRAVVDVLDGGLVWRAVLENLGREARFMAGTAEFVFNHEDAIGVREHGQNGLGVLYGHDAIAKIHSGNSFR